MFHGTENEEFVRDACKDLTRIVFHNMRCNNLTLRAYNRMLCRPDFYKKFSTEYVLIFQTDSILFPQSPFEIEDFFGYDYVGAPWKWYLEADPSFRGGNGGLSLRRVEAMKNVLRTYPYPRQQQYPEDLYLCHLPINIAPQEISQRFSVESVYYPTPFGAHKPWLYLDSNEYLKFQRYAPSIKTLVDLN